MKGQIEDWIAEASLQGFIAKLFAEEQPLQVQSWLIDNLVTRASLLVSEATSITRKNKFFV